MNLCRHIPFVFLCCIHSFFFLTPVNAQVNHLGYFRQGEKLFRESSYYEAAQYYEKYLSLDKKSGPPALPFAVEKKTKGLAHRNPRQEAIYHLAECYRQVNDYARAEWWYALARSFSPASYPEEHYWYAVTLRANGRYAQAIDELTLFEKEYTGMSPILVDADRQLESLRFIQEQLARKDDNSFRLDRQADFDNTSAYAPTVRSGDTLVFTAIHAVSSGAKNATPEYHNDLYEVDGPGSSDTGALAAAYPLPFSSGSEMHSGLASFSADGRQLFFTRWTKKQRRIQAAVWSSHRADTGWTAPVRLGAPMNLEGYNSTQPFLTRDGRYLLFSSDRPGGVGNYDLWYASLDSEYQVITVANLGETINTPGDDEAPYYHENSRTLVFASNGRAGMGGFDIYYSQGNFNFSRWDKPQNPGIPLNSSKDDLYFISTDEDNCWNTGWLSSDRGSGCCLALYSVLQNNTQFIAGRIVDDKTRQPIAGVRLILTDPRHEGRELSKGSTDSLGNYSFVLRNTSRFQLAAEKDGYRSGAGDFLVHMVTGRDTLHTEDLALRPIPVPVTKAARPTIVGNFPYKKSALPASARAVLDSLALLLKSDPTLHLQVEGYTDGIGGDAYNLRLAGERVDVCIRYLLKKGIDPSRLLGKNFGKCCPLEPETMDGKDNPAGREINRRVEYRLFR